MAPPPPHATLLLLRLAALAPLLLLLAPACSAAPGVFQVRRRFPADGGGGGGVAALRSHDGCHHGRLLAAADLPLAGLSLPTDTEYVRTSTKLLPPPLPPASRTLAALVCFVSSGIPRWFGA
jgi:hypothetical protein